ncbi:MAG: peptide chain release factor 2 [Gammaproteobacteria bacterium]|nr:peptide chain release factor 2 [Gammaproteobacteria bacterium]
MGQIEDPNLWANPEEAQKLGKEKVALEGIVLSFNQLEQALVDAQEMMSLVALENDATTFVDVVKDIDGLEKQLAALEFARMFSGEMDAHNAFVEVQAGSGGTEAQDWAEMLLRMYLRWADKHDFKAQILELSTGDVAGIKGATVQVSGPYAFGWLRTETGVHRLVRKSPFDSGNRRHTSFASIFVSPEIDDDIEIDINPADLKIDTYRSSGAGGQHVNTTDSAVRITHQPTGIVVQCQNERSQHKNKAQALKQLRAKLYEIEIQKKTADQQSLEASKADISWGSQIRSYVLDQSRIKDLRTGLEKTNTQAVLDGDLDAFIEASLKQGVEE